jgi:DNA-binding transcriptional LysR family regulator
MILLNSNLSAFLAVVENSTVSAAAKTLGITQTGTTQRIKALEQELGTSLFLRSRMGMKLTPEGVTLLRNCMQVRELEGRMTAEMQRGGLAHEVDVTITGPGGVIARRVIPQCAKVCSDWPMLNMRFISESLSDRIGLVKRGIADFAIVTPSEVQNEMDSKVIAPNEMILVANAAWKDRPLTEILETERLISYHPDDPLGLDYLKEFGLLDSLRRPRMLANDNEMVMSLVKMGMGFTLLPKEVVNPLVEQGALIALNEGKSMTIRFALTWYPRKEMPDYFRELIKAIK